MTTTLQNSNTTLVGSIPANWSIEKTGSIFSERREKVSDQDYAPLSVTKKGVVPQLEDAAKSDAHDNRKLVRKGDFVINSRSDRKGSSGISEYDGSVSLIYTVLHGNRLDSKFSHYLLRSYPFQEEFYRWGQGIVADLWTTNWEKMKNIQLPIPPLEEQCKIADYLDRETSEIDALLEKQQELLKLIEEKRRTEITSSINLFGDNNDQERFRYICSIDPSTNHSFSDDDEVNFYPMEGIGTDGAVDNNVWRKYKDVKNGYTTFQDNDVVIAKVTPCFENYKGAKMKNMKNGVGFGTTELIVLRPTSKVLSDYLFLITQSQDFVDWLTGGMRGTGGLKRIVLEEVKNMRVNLPNKNTQTLTIDSLNELNDKFSELKLSVSHQIELLKERRIALISAAVTGKLVI